MKRVGLIGYDCHTGLGELTRQIARFAAIDRVLIVPHPKLGVTNRVPGSVVYRSNHELLPFLNAVDVVLFCERPYLPDLLPLCQKLRKRTVCVPMQEWMPIGRESWPDAVDLYLCPTRHCYDELHKRLPCVEFLWPIDIARFPFRQREVCKQFLFVEGQGGWRGRKGGETVRRAKEIWPKMPLRVTSQARNDWSRLGVEWFSSPKDNRDLYIEGDVLLCPHTVDGIGLECQEALASGLPLIVTDGRPWNEFPAVVRLSNEKSRLVIMREVDWHRVTAENLVEACQSVLGKDIAAESLQGRQWAESRAWDKKKDEFNRLVRGEPCIC